MARAVSLCVSVSDSVSISVSGFRLPSEFVLVLGKDVRENH